MQSNKIRITDRDLERTNDLKIYNLEILFDPNNQDKVELYYTDKNGQRIEGGQFDLESFMNHVEQFYHDNY